MTVYIEMAYMYKIVFHTLTFTSRSFSIKRTSNATAISSTSPCVVINCRKSSITTVGSLDVESVAVALTRHIRIRHRAIGRIENWMACYSCSREEYLYNPSRIVQVPTFTYWNCTTKSTNSATAISSANACVVSDNRKPSETAVGRHRIKGIGAIFISSRTVSHRATGRSSRGRTGYGYGAIKQ